MTAQIPDAMRLALMEPDDYGPHCAEDCIDADGWIVATCTRPPDRHDTHVCAHTGHRWAR